MILANQLQDLVAQFLLQDKRQQDREEVGDDSEDDNISLF